MSMKGYDRLPPSTTAALVAGALLAVPLFGWLPLLGIGADIVTSAAILDKMPK